MIRLGVGVYDSKMGIEDQLDRVECCARARWLERRGIETNKCGFGGVEYDGFGDDKWTKSLFCV